MRHGEKPTAEAHACWDGLIGQYAWPTSTMFSVMMCESGGDPWNTGIQTRYGVAHGLMQDMDGPYDPAQNMAVAYQKYQASGLGPWSSSASCWRNGKKG
jgi:hypothetical protein